MMEGDKCLQELGREQDFSEDTCYKVLISET